MRGFARLKLISAPSFLSVRQNNFAREKKVERRIRCWIISLIMKEMEYYTSKCLIFLKKFDNTRDFVIIDFFFLIFVFNE